MASMCHTGLRRGTVNNFQSLVVGCCCLLVGIVSTSALSSGCDYSVHVNDNEQLTFTMSNFTKTNGKHHRYCTLLVKTSVGRKIVFDLTYKPRSGQKSHQTSSSCHSEYVHIGNDFTRLDVEVMTSYKFCGVQGESHEVVSRGSRMWLVFKTEKGRPKELQLDVWSRKPVSCSPEEFTCSPVQCVSRGQVCDGVPDCDNRHDEYCVKTTEQDQTSKLVSLSQAASCFRCGDGTCISPRLPRYDLDWGRSLWYLCDGYPHCPDQWDERPDICLDLQRGRVDAVIQCVPSDLQFGLNQSVIMWAEHRCDDVIDCHHGDDEIRCRREVSDSSIHADSMTLGFAIGFLVVICCGAAFVIHHLRTRTIGPSTETATESTSDDILLQTRHPTTYATHHGHCEECLEPHATKLALSRGHANGKTSSSCTKQETVCTWQNDKKKPLPDTTPDDVFTHYASGIDDEHDDENGNERCEDDNVDNGGMLAMATDTGTT